MLEDGVILFFALFHVDKGVAGPRDEDSRRAMINRVERNLEVADVSLYVTLATNACLGDEFFTLPVPHEDLPVGVACQRHDVALLLGVERTGYELIRVVSIAVLYLLRQSLLLLLAGDVVD